LRRKWKSKRAVKVRLGSVNNELATVSEIEEGDVEEGWASLYLHCDLNKASLLVVVMKLINPHASQELAVKD